MPNVLFDFKRGGANAPEILYGKVDLRPTLAHKRGTSLVLPAVTTWDLVEGKATAVNIQPTPAPTAENQIDWAYAVKVTDNFGKTFEWLVGVPDVTGDVLFADLPRYFETKPPLFGEGPEGPAGEAATVAVGTVTGGTTASVTNSGTNNDAILDFVLPEGPQGPKGDGIQVISDLSFVASPLDYPLLGSVFTTGTEVSWPEPCMVIYTMRSEGGRTVQTATSVQTGNTYRRVAAGDNVWTEFKRFAWDDVATSTTDGLMSEADKNLLSGLFGSYAQKVATDPIASYSPGTNTMLVRGTDGWPFSGFNIVTTYRQGGLGATFESASYQVALPYIGTDDITEMLFRRVITGGGWGDWQTIMTVENQTYITPEQFGAKADDSTDDTAAIQAAIDAAVLQGKTLVLDGTKTYKVTAGIKTPAINEAKSFSLESRGGIATLHSSDQSTVAVLEIAGSPNGGTRTVTQNVDRESNYFVISGIGSELPDGTLFDMVSSQPWYYDPRTESTDARRSELQVLGSRSINGITMLGTFAESYNASTETLSVQPYYPMKTTIRGLRIVRDLPAVAQESSRHGLLRVSYTVDSLIEDIHLDGGTEYGLSLRNNYGIRVQGGSATNCNNYWTGYGISVAGSSFFDISGIKITNTRRGIDVTQGGKTVSRYGKIHDNYVIGGGKNSRGENYGWNLDGSTAAQQSGMGSHGAADRIEYYNNTFVRLHDPITLRGGNESIVNNTVWGKTRNGAFNIAFGGGTISVIGNKAVSGTETGPYNQTKYNDPTSNLGAEFLVVYESINPNMHLIVKDNVCEVQTDFIRIQDAQVSVPLRMDIQNNTALYRTSEPEARLLYNASAQGLYTFPASAYRWTVALNRQANIAGSPTMLVTKNINLSNAYVLEYDRSGATT